MPAAKKKRYAEGRILDQTDCKFGIKIEDDEVLLMSDESELSSLNEAEYDHVKKAFDRVFFYFLEKNRLYEFCQKNAFCRGVSRFYIYTSTGCFS